MFNKTSIQEPIHKVMVWVVRVERPEQPVRSVQNVTDKHNQYSVLLLRTLPSRGGFWQPVTGWVDEGESPEQAALREAFEESGQNLQGLLHSLDFIFSFNNRHDSRLINEGSYYGICKNLPDPDKSNQIEVSLDKNEHDAFQWISVDEPKAILALLTHEGSRESFRKLSVKLGKIFS